jgi:hypothetical protein
VALAEALLGSAHGPGGPHRERRGRAVIHAGSERCIPHQVEPARSAKLTWFESA